MKSVKKTALILAALSIFLIMAGAPAAASGTLEAVEAGRVIKLSVAEGTEEDVGLYNRPSAKGETVAEASAGEFLYSSIKYRISDIRICT